MSYFLTPSRLHAPRFIRARPAFVTRRLPSRIKIGSSLKSAIRRHLILRAVPFRTNFEIDNRRHFPQLSASSRGAVSHREVYEVRLYNPGDQSLQFVTVKADDDQAGKYEHALLLRYPEYSRAEVWNGKEVVVGTPNLYGASKLTRF